MGKILWGYKLQDGRKTADPELENLAAMVYFFATLMEAKGEPRRRIAEAISRRYGLSLEEAGRAVFDVLKHRQTYESGSLTYPKIYSVTGMYRAFMSGHFDNFGGELVVAKRIERNYDVWLGLCESDNPSISSVRGAMRKVVPKDAQLSFVVPPNISPCKSFYRILLDTLKPKHIIINDDRALFPWFNDYQDFLSILLYHSEFPIDKCLHIVNQHYEKKLYRASQFDWYVPQYPWSEKKGSNNGESL